MAKNTPGKGVDIRVGRNHTEGPLSKAQLDPSMKARRSSREDNWKTVPRSHSSIRASAWWPSPNGLLREWGRLPHLLTSHKGPGSSRARRRQLRTSVVFSCFLPFANRERLAGVQGAAMSPLVVGTDAGEILTGCAGGFLSRGLLHHLVIELAHPAVGHGSHRYALRLTPCPQTRRHLRPGGLGADQTMGGLDDRRAKRRTGRPDQTGVGHALAAGGVARTRAAKTRQLLARAETLKAANLGPKRPGGHRANARLLLQRYYHGILGRGLVQAFLHMLQGVGDTPQFLQVPLHDPPAVVP